MVKSEIISKLSSKIHQKLKKSELKNILDIITSTIVKEIKHKKSTEIRSFGRFYLKKIEAKLNARNPRTGKKISSKEKISIAFNMSKELKNRINSEEIVN